MTTEKEKISLKQIITYIVIILIFIASMICVVVGQRNVGLEGLLLMFAGLAGLLTLLGLYNNKYR